MTPQTEAKRNETSAPERRYELGEVIRPFAANIELLTETGYGSTTRVTTNELPDDLTKEGSR